MERRFDSDGRLAADTVIDADEGDVGAYWRLVQLARAERGGRAVVDYARADTLGLGDLLAALRPDAHRRMNAPGEIRLRIHI